MRHTFLGLVAISTLLTGCASENWFRMNKETFPTASSKNPAVRILAVWQVGEGQGPDGLSTRGFAGQIFFLESQNQVPAKVDGDVRIYLFDDQAAQEERDKPIHQFDYPRDSWKVRLTKTKMGPAYAVFVPYTRKGSHKAVCSLRMRFVPADGGPAVYSDMAQVSLPGRDNSPEERFALEKSRERTASALGEHPELDQPIRESARRPESVRAETVETAKQRQVPRTPAAAPLTPAERDRLIAEARARASAEGLLVQGAAPERRSGSNTSRSQARSNPRGSVQQVNFDELNEEVTEDTDSDDDVEEVAPRSATRRPASSRAPRAEHPLRRATPDIEDHEDEYARDTESLEDESADTDRNDAPRQVVRKQSTPVRTQTQARGRHPLMRDDEGEDAEDTPVVDSYPARPPIRAEVNRLSRTTTYPDESQRHHATDEEIDRLEQAAIEELAQMSRMPRDPALRAMRTWSVDMPR